MEYNFDARDEKEKMFSSLVFNSYINSNSFSEYNGFISDISNRYHKSVNYLKSLREVYVDVYASDDEKKEYTKKKKVLNSTKGKFFSYCDKLFELPVEERNCYVLASNVSIGDLNVCFEKYKKYNGKYSNYVDDFFEQYKKFYENYKSEETKKNYLEFYNKSCSFYDKIVDMGFYGTRGYIQYLISSGESFNKEFIVSIAYRYKKFIQKYDADTWTDYELLMKENKEKNVLLVKDRILSFGSKLSSGEEVDIIDYYMTVGISFYDFLQLSEGILSSSDIVRFKRFILSYQGINNESCFNNDVTVSDDIKQSIICFLHNNNIPFEYYNCALVKYLSGGLDQYIGISMKKTNL